MVNLWRFDPAKGIKIHEPDDYLEKKDKSSETPDQPKWVVSILQPVVIGTMVACISQSIAQLIRYWAPDWRHYFFIIAPVLTALAGYATHHTIQKRYLASNESIRYKIFELVVIFLLCKISTHLDNTIGEIINQAQGWFAEPKTFFDGETLLMYALSLIAWFAAAVTAKDLRNITDPTLYIGEKSPIRRISNRFYAGGLILLVTTAFARVRFMDILQNQNPRVPGLILNILIYFMLGLFILGQLNYLHHTGVWHRQRVQFDTDVSVKWLRYSILFLGVVTFIAFLLPTGYTVGLLDIAQYFINLILFIVNAIFFILSFPVLLLLSLLFKGTESKMSLPERPTIGQPPKPPPTTPSNYWLEIIRSLAFWVIALIALGYVIHGYLRDRPAIIASVRKFKPIQWILILLRNIALILKRLTLKVTETIPQIVKRFRRSIDQNLMPNRQRRGTTYRDRVFVSYLNTLDVAKEEGVARTKSQTPSEYDKVLEPKLSDSSQPMSRLTDVFIKARYSRHKIDKETVDQSNHDAKSVQDALRSLREKSDGFEIS